MTNTLTPAEKKSILIAGYAGLLAAILVGAGEFLLQYNLQGGYEAPDYAYFGRVSVERMTMGHFLAVLAAPLYVCGYWHLSKMLAPASEKLSKIVFLLGAYSFIIGTAWISQRIFLGLTVHEINQGSDIASLLARFSSVNEPFVNVLRIAMLIVSGIWIYLIAQGKTYYPKWMALFSPIALLILIFAIYFTAPAIGGYVLPVAMNVTHLIIFGLSLYSARSL